MSDLQSLVTADRRLLILTLLAESSAYTASYDLLHMALSRMGHAVSMDRLNTDIEWLFEQGLLMPELVSGVHLARLSVRGLDVAQGVATVPGVARPRPA